MIIELEPLQSLPVVSSLKSYLLTEQLLVEIIHQIMVADSWRIPDSLLFRISDGNSYTDQEIPHVQQGRTRRSYQGNLVIV